MKPVNKIFDVATLGLFKTPDMPEVKDPSVAPDPESLEARRKLEKGMARRGGAGRTSTIMSESNTLG